MTKEARHHHYLPQCYLRGFLPSGQKKPNLVVLDLKRRNIFETSTRNIAGERDFNRIEVDNVRHDKIENDLSFFEKEVASAIKQLEQDYNLRNESTYAVIMNLIALITIRNPKMRSGWADAMSQVYKMLMGLMLSDKGRWEATLNEMRQDGIEIDKNISYEQMKKFYESGEYDIITPTESHIVTEFQGIDAILPYLFQRGWKLVLASEETGPFITCDGPVSIAWKHPDKVPPLYRRCRPGFGMKDAELVFPVTKNIALIGEFETENQIIHATKTLVSAINRRILSFAFSQIYVPHLLFVFTDLKGSISPGCALVNMQ